MKERQARARNSKLFEFLQHTKEFTRVRQLFDGIDLAECYFAVLIYHEDGAFADAGKFALIAEDAEFLGHLAVGPVIGSQGVFQRPDLLLPRGSAIDGVHANAHDLGIVGGELGEVRVVGRHLPGSNRRPVEGVEGDNHVVLAAAIAQAELLLDAADESGQFEFGGEVSDFERRHAVLLHPYVSHDPRPGAKSAEGQEVTSNVSARELAVTRSFGTARKMPQSSRAWECRLLSVSCGRHVGGRAPGAWKGRARWTSRIPMPIFRRTAKPVSFCCARVSRAPACEFALTSGRRCAPTGAVWGPRRRIRNIRSR